MAGIDLIWVTIIAKNPSSWLSSVRLVTPLSLIWKNKNKLFYFISKKLSFENAVDFWYHRHVWANRYKWASNIEPSLYGSCQEFFTDGAWFFENRAKNATSLKRAYFWHVWLGVHQNPFSPSHFLISGYYVKPDLFK